MMRFLMLSEEAQQSITGVDIFWNSSITRRNTSLERKPTAMCIRSTVSARVTTFRPTSPLPSSSYQSTRIFAGLSPILMPCCWARSTATSMPPLICAPTSALKPEIGMKAPSLISGVSWAAPGPPGRSASSAVNRTRAVARPAIARLTFARLAIVIILRSVSQSDGWPTLGPRLERLEGGGRAQHRRVGVPAAHNLQPHRQAFRREAAWHAGRRLPRQIERHGERQAVEQGRRRASVDGLRPLVRPGIRGPCRHRHLRREQQVARLEELLRSVVQLRSRELRLEKLRGADVACALD